MGFEGVGVDESFRRTERGKRVGSIVLPSKKTFNDWSWCEWDHVRVGKSVRRILDGLSTGFSELKENREYVEREDEFDIKDDDEDDETKAKKKKERKSNVVYLDDASSLTFADLKLWDTDLSAYWTDADEDVLHYLPVEVIVDYEVQAQMEEKKKKWERKQALKAERKKKEEEEKEKNGEKKETTQMR